MEDSAFESTKRNETDRRALLAGLGGLAAGTFLTAGRAEAGPLNPPAAPASTPGPEPRIAINSENTPGDATSHFRITEPGSYYLAGNITGESEKNGIIIAASNVTIDLNGFDLSGEEGALTGIATEGPQSGIHLRNGIVRRWGLDGINLAAGGFGRHSIVESVTASQNGGSGIRGADNTVIRRCQASNNTAGGISVRFYGLVSECKASNNTGVGILFGSDSTVEACLATLNNTVGIQGGPNGMVSGCEARINSSHGFNVGGACVVRGCTAIGNASNAGIRLSGASNVADGNVCIGNLRGIEVPAADNLITRNVCRGNTTANWDIAADNKCLVVNAVNAAAINGDSGGTSLGSTDPNANYTY